MGLCSHGKVLPILQGNRAEVAASSVIVQWSNWGYTFEIFLWGAYVCRCMWLDVWMDMHANNLF